VHPTLAQKEGDAGKTIREASGGLTVDDLDKIKDVSVKKAQRLAREKRREIDDLMNEVIYA
jgi:hypothetical protein